MRNKYIKVLIANLICLMLVLMIAGDVYAVNTVPSEDQAEAANERKLLRVETNEIDNWPEGPIIGAEGAILMDADTGIILYAKNIHEHLYPASTTKLMTALLALENSSMDEIVTFSHDAIFNTDYDSSRIGIDVGEQLTMEQCLYGLLLGSANEVAYAIAEHIGGDLNSFVDMMNQRARDLGCYDTHFVNANGLPDEEHYTSPYDLCIIARECFKNDSLMTISGSTHYTIPPTNIQSEERPMDNHHQMLKGFKYEYEGVLGGKTGYTKAARQTLVTCAQRNGIRLLCVIMKEESPNQFTDTIELLDYGFGYFQKMNISENETRYDLNSATFFNTNLDIIGSSKPILTINKAGEVILPKTADFKDANVAISYFNPEGEKKSIARLTYTFSGQYVGETTLDYANNNATFFEFDKIITEGGRVIPQTVEPEKDVVFVSAKKLAIIMGIVLASLIIIFFIIKGIRRYIVSSRRALRKKRKRYKKRSDNLYL